MDTSGKPARLVLLKSGHFLENNNEKPVVGWYQTSSGVGGLQNSDVGLACIRVIHQKQNKNGEYENVYDSIRIFENLGVILILVNDNKEVAFIKTYRMIGDRLEDTSINYISDIQNQNRWQELVESLGAWTWELPKGIPSQEYRRQNAVSNKTTEEYILDIAQEEANEEAGIIFENFEIIGYVNPQTTYWAHAQPVIVANVSKITNQKPEIKEIISEVKFFSVDEISNLIKKGELVDSLSLASLCLLSFYENGKN